MYKPTPFLANLFQTYCMKFPLWCLLFLPFFAGAQKAEKLHRKALVADSHNDILTACLEKKVSLDQDLRGTTQSDLNRFKQAGIDWQLFSVWCDGEKQNPFDWAMREMDILDAVISRNPSRIKLCASSKDLQAALRAGQLAAMFGVEGGHMIENDLQKMETLYRRGTRYMTLTWNNSTPWASSAMDEVASPGTKLKNGQEKGLSAFGKTVVQKMNDLGMMVDLSHVGEKTFWDAINTTTKPVLVSHSNAYTLCPVFRNLKDDQIDAVGKNGGVIQLNFYSAFVDSNFKKRELAFFGAHAAELAELIKGGMQKEYAQSVVVGRYPAKANAIRPPLSALLDHVDYLVQRIGVDHVGMGSDFDGITSSPQGLDDVTAYPMITKALLDRGYSPREVKKIMGGNLLRVLKANEVH